MEEKTNKKALWVLVILLIVTNLVLVAITFLPAESLPSIFAKTADDHALPPDVSPVGDTGDFDEFNPADCNCQGDPEAFYNVGANVSDELISDIPASAME